MTRRVIAAVLAAGAIAFAGCGSSGDGDSAYLGQVPAEQPTALTTGTWGLFVAETDRGVVTRRTPGAEVITSRRLDAPVTALAAADDHLVVVLGGTNEIVLLRSEDLSVEARTRPVDGPPGAITAVGYDGEVVIADDANDRLLRLAVPSLRVVRSVPLPRGSSPMALAAKGRVYLTARNATSDGRPGVIRVGRDGAVRVRPVPGLSESPCGIALSGDRVLSVATRAGMAVLRPATLAPLRDGTDAEPVTRVVLAFPKSAIVVTDRDEVIEVAYGTGERLATLGFAAPRGACGAALLRDLWMPDARRGALVRFTIPA